jgi:DNA polymerase-3 subunit delta'
MADAIWRSLRGHRQQLEHFRRAIARGRTAHAYLFVGPEGIGKRLFARTLAQCLFCPRVPDAELEACGACASCRQVVAGTHPDLLTLACPEGKRELPLAALIGERDKRGREGLCHDLSLRPMLSHRRVAIIDDAHTMTAESANALLKTLEEPPAGSILILLSPSADAILPTIRSRCQPVQFAPLSDHDVADLLVAQGSGLSDAEARDLAALSGGSLETARQLLQPELRALRRSLHEALSRSPVDPLRLSGLVLAAIEEHGGDPAGQRQMAVWVVDFAMEFFRSRLRELAGGEPPLPEAARDAIDRLGAQFERCLDAAQQLEHAMPVPLCLDGCWDELSRIARGATPV